MTNRNPLQQLEEHGQSYWLDNLTRSKIHGGELARRVREEGLKGVTSNPKIFSKAIASGEDYDAQIRELAARGRSVSEIYEAVVTQDIRDACDVLADVHRDSDGRDGFVSLEVSPHLAYDPDGTLEEARRLFAAVDRPNVMIKIPATEIALPVIEEALYEGINVNITLLFSVERYIAVAEAYLAAMNRRLNEKLPLRDVASVASFFLSRIDVLTDELLAQRIGTARGTGETPRAGPETLLGRAAIASARHAYGVYHTLFAGGRWERLSDAGARTQRLLWASTSNKTPVYDDLRYIEPLIGPDTVTTLPDATAAEYARRGRPETRLQPSPDPSNEVGERLSTFGVDLGSVARRLEEEGVRKFVDPYDALLTEIARGSNRAIASVEIDAAGVLDVDELTGALQDQKIARRLFARDTSLWSWGGEHATEWAMGWLHSPEDFFDRIDELKGFADELRNDDVDDVLMIGMGGSTNAAKVARDVFTRPDRSPRLRVLADTDPDAVSRLDDQIDWTRSLVIVASKSGTTQETLSLFDHCWSRVSAAVDGEPGRRFVAITDEGTPLAETAETKGFRHLFLNPSSIGGRYSALSYFGLIPLALAGADVAAVLRSAIAARRGCGPDVPAPVNPAVRLGGLLGALGAHHGRDKVTLTFSDEIASLGLWVRQLLAESTGKDGTGLVPVLDEPPRPASEYGPDRVFVHTCLWNGHEPLEDDPTLGPVLEKGHPVVRIRVPSREALGGEFLRWEIATAVAAVLLHVDPFDQPDVESTKSATRELMSASASNGTHGVKVADVERAALWAAPDTDAPTPTEESSDAARPLDPVRAALHDFLARSHDGDYVALLPFLAPSEGTDDALQTLRATIQESYGLATTLAYGPAYLHSVGQLHKGGPDTGLFIVLTNGGSDETAEGTLEDLATLHEAQALADFDTLARAGRRVVRLQVRDEVVETLRELSEGWISAPGGQSRG